MAKKCSVWYITAYWFTLWITLWGTLYGSEADEYFFCMRRGPHFLIELPASLLLLLTLLFTRWRSIFSQSCLVALAFDNTFRLKKIYWQSVYKLQHKKTCTTDEITALFNLDRFVRARSRTTGFRTWFTSETRPCKSHTIYETVPFSFFFFSFYLFFYIFTVNG